MKTPRIIPLDSHKSYASNSGRNEPVSRKEREAALSLSRFFEEAIKPPTTHYEYFEHGYRAGELHESNLWQIASNVENARPFSVRESIEIPSMNVGLLVDCSGSMCSAVRSGGTYMSTISAARILALGLGKAMNHHDGIRLTIGGHTEESGNVILIMCKRADTDFEEKNFSYLTAQSGNLDGLALVAFAREMKKTMPQDENGIILLISDGAPCHSASVMERAFDACQRLHNLHVLPIGVGNQDDETCKRIYNGRDYILASDVISCAPTVSQKINQLIEELKPM